MGCAGAASNLLTCLVGITTYSGHRIKPGYLYQTLILMARTLVKKVWGSSGR